MAQPDPPPEYSVVLHPSSIDADGAPHVLAPDAEQRVAIAGRLGLDALPSFRCEVVLSPWGRGGWQVKGILSAQVQQTCVVSLEPVNNSVEEIFLVRYLPAKALAAFEKDQDELLADPSEEDPPELLPDAGIDIGELAVEYLSLALDPYPRRDDAVSDFAEEAEESEAAGRPNPFAALSELKKKV